MAASLGLRSMEAIYLSRISQEPWLVLEGRIKDEEIVYLKMMLCLMDNIFMGFFPQKLNEMNKS